MRKMRLKIVKDKPLKAGKQITRDANDSLSSFPDAKTERREPTLEQKNQRGTTGKGKWS